MSIRVKLKATGETGTGYNVNGAASHRCDWVSDNESLPAQDRIRSDEMVSLFVELDGGEWVDLLDAVMQDRVTIDESNGGSNYG